MASETGERRSRRDLLIGLGTVVAVGAGWQLWGNRPRGFDFVAIDGLPGWRRLAFEGVSSPTGGLGDAAFLGLDGNAEEVAPLPAAALCDTLFRMRPPGAVPVAAFSDFFCPFCRVLTARLADRAASPASGIAVTWHELPLLGPVSETAARAALAADRQGAYAGFQARLLSTGFRPSAAFLADMAVASLTLGVWGTPAVVVGRTLVMGEIGEAALDRLIAMEAAAGPLPC